MSTYVVGDIQGCFEPFQRLLKKVKKEHMIPLLQDFGVPCKGSKEELALALAEQLHYETDEEEAE